MWDFAMAHPYLFVFMTVAVSGLFFSAIASLGKGGER
jgi:hypothetical protein